MSDLITTSEELLTKAKKLEEDLKPLIVELEKECMAVADAARKVSESWSGSFLGYHHELYYRDFEKPALGERFSPEWGGIHGIPPGWEARDPDHVKARIEQLADTKLDSIEQRANEILAPVKQFQSDLQIELSHLRDAGGFDRESALLDDLEKFPWGKRRGEFIYSEMPRNFMTRDQTAMAQGARVPAHLFYEALALESDSQCSAVEEFFTLSQRLLRQVQKRAAQIPGAPGNRIADHIAIVSRICLRFHEVVRQLRKRRENRPTLDVTDEYDVQDLLHALLRLNVDDIRPEEWTPSYAGKSSRMDFLLKNEQIVIEAKMTRPGLDAAKVGEQLIVDAAYYKGHPGCKTLVCFVYDPDSRINNPRGLEADLKKLSSPDLEVIAIIAP